MPRDIAEVLNRRSDLSTFVVHLTKDTDDATAHDNLASILASGTIEARSPMGWKGTLDAPDIDCMRVVCFSETPLEHTYTLFQDIAGRDVHLTTYGLAFTKEVARRNAINPVWYVGMSKDMYGDWEIAKALNKIRDDAAAAPGGFALQPAAKVLPFIEPMGRWKGYSQKEFSWEREWRHLGALKFLPTEVALVFCPEAEIREFEASGGYRAVDPSWSLERMIDHLRKPARRSAQPEPTEAPAVAVGASDRPTIVVQATAPRARPVGLGPRR